MARHVHVHIHRGPAADAWEENKHPRASNGQFGPIETAKARMKEIDHKHPDAIAHHNKHDAHTEEVTENGKRYETHRHGGWEGTLFGVTELDTGKHFRSGALHPIPPTVLKKEAPAPAPAAPAEKKFDLEGGTRVKFKRGLTGEMAEGSYAGGGPDKDGNVTVTSQGRVLKLHHSKVERAYPKQ